MKSIVAKLPAMFAAAAARLPWCVLYAISTFVYFVLCHGIGYRRKVVMKNLRESFPEKSEQEIKKIAREFYRNFADMIVETVKLLHVSDEEMLAHVSMICEEIDRHERIVLIGALYPMSIAVEFQTDLIILGKKCGPVPQL